VALTILAGNRGARNGNQAWHGGLPVALEITATDPYSHYVASSLQSLLLLEPGVTLALPAVEFFSRLDLTGATAAVSGYLQRRQFFYRLLVIEKAFGARFQVPALLTQEEQANVRFVYHALSERSFSWSFWQDVFQFPASAKGKKLLDKIDGAFPFLIEIDELRQPLLGQEVNLGAVQITVENTALVFPDEVRRELQRLDGHLFEVALKSLSGTAHYRFSDLPPLPDLAADVRLAPWIELEQKLDDTYFESVNRLAAATLAGFSDEEKLAVTERFTLGEEAFATERGN
jgi:hypothetical protein